jgi:hypothetical protein
MTLILKLAITVVGTAVVGFLLSAAPALLGK